MNYKQSAINLMAVFGTLASIVAVTNPVAFANSDCRHQSGTVDLPAGTVLRSMNTDTHGNVTLVNAESLSYSSFCSGETVTSYFVTRNGLSYSAHINK